MTKQRVRTRDVNAVERVTLALQLRKQRLPYHEIAQRCGYGSAQAAHKAIMRELERRVVPNVDELREQELEILDAIHQKVWPLVFENPKGKPDLFAVDRLLALSVARRQLLNLDVTPDVIASAQVVVRELPPGYLSIPQETTA